MVVDAEDLEVEFSVAADSVVVGSGVPGCDVGLSSACWSGRFLLAFDVRGVFGGAGGLVAR